MSIQKAKTSPFILPYYYGNKLQPRTIGSARLLSEDEKPARYKNVNVEIYFFVPDGREEGFFCPKDDLVFDEA